MNCDKRGRNMCCKNNGSVLMVITTVFPNVGFLHSVCITGSHFTLIIS
jgi:hypothetical protein